MKLQPYECNSGFKADIDAYRRYRKTLGYSDSSMKQLKSFDKFCCTYFPDATVLEKEIYDQWMTVHDDEKATSYNARLATMRQFALWQIANGKPAFVDNGSYSMDESRHDAFVFSQHELDVFFRAADNIEKTSKNDMRHLVVPAIFRLMYTCGLRPGEARRIRLCDLSFSTLSLVIHETKTHNDRRIPIGKDIAQLLADYLSKAMYYQRGMEFLFERPRGGCYGTDWMKVNFRHCVELAGIGPHGDSFPRPYDLRHSFATHTLDRWILAGEDISKKLPFLMGYLGHNAIDSTMYYVHTSPQVMLSTGLLDWEVEDDE